MTTGISNLIKAWRICSGIDENIPAGELWSSPATWGGAVPVNGQAVTIPLGKTVTLDTTTANLGHLQIFGNVVAKQGQDVYLKADSITVQKTGLLRIGTPAAPYINQGIIELRGQIPTTNDPATISRRLRFPRACGDRPQKSLDALDVAEVPPRMRG